MSIISETFQLAKMLFSPINTKEVKQLMMTHYPNKGVAYLMWCGKLIYNSKKPGLGLVSEVNRNHEMIHLKQAKEKGSWIWFYICYLYEWLKKNPFKNGQGAYYTNKFEVEAYSKELDFKYLERRPKNNQDKFKVESNLFSKCKYPYNYREKIREMFCNV